jgi:membrane-bound lytic murein transglycosylase A
VCLKPGTIDGWVPFSRFMCAQDTGSAISGTKRADLFWGSGAYAQTVAGHLQHPGRLYFLVILPESAAP